MKVDLNDIKEKLQQSGIKATHQRMVIYGMLMGMDNHPTVEQIYDKVKPNNPSISLATVYKALEIFVEKGLLNKVSSNEGHMRYDPIVDNHSHIYCQNTKEIVDFHDEELNGLILEFFKKKNVQNLKIQNISLQINGEKINPLKGITIK